MLVFLNFAGAKPMAANSGVGTSLAGNFGPKARLPLSEKIGDTYL